MSKSDKSRLWQRVLWGLLAVVITGGLYVWMLESKGIPSILLCLVEVLVMYLCLEIVVYCVSGREVDDDEMGGLFVVALFITVVPNILYGDKRDDQIKAAEAADLAAKEQQYQEAVKSWEGKEGYVENTAKIVKETRTFFL